MKLSDVRDGDSLALFDTYTNPVDAAIVQGVLDTNGVESVVNDQIMSTLYCGIGAFGVRLYVRADQLELARSILDSQPLK